MPGTFDWRRSKCGDRESIGPGREATDGPRTDHLGTIDVALFVLVSEDPAASRLPEPKLPWMPEWTWMTHVKGEKVHADGWIHGYGQPGNHLYVNRGIGFSLLPLRSNCAPEVTLFILRRTP